MNNISKETFLQAEGKVRDAMLYDMLDTIHKKICTCQSHMNPRIRALEKKRKRDTGIAAIGGVVGGYLAIISQRIFRWL